MTNHLANELRRILRDLDADSAQDISKARVRPPVLRMLESLDALGDQPVEVDASTELTANFGLEPEQELRDRALGHAIRVAEAGMASTSVLDLADVYAAYIRDGSRPT